MSDKNTPATREGELLYGAKAIAEFLGIRDRQALYLIEKGSLPVWREGRTVCARRSTLKRWIEQSEAKGMSSGPPESDRVLGAERTR